MATADGYHGSGGLKVHIQRSQLILFKFPAFDQFCKIRQICLSALKIHNDFEPYKKVKHVFTYKCANAY